MLCSHVPFNGLVLSASLSLFPVFFLSLCFFCTSDSLHPPCLISQVPHFFFSFFNFPCLSPVSSSLFIFLFTTTHLHLCSVSVSLPSFKFLNKFFKLFDPPLCIPLLPLLPVFVARHPSVSFSLSLFVPHTFSISASFTPMLAPSTQDLHISLSPPEDNASWTDPLVPARGLGALLWEKTLQ